VVRGQRQSQRSRIGISVQRSCCVLVAERRNRSTTGGQSRRRRRGRRRRRWWLWTVSWSAGLGWDHGLVLASGHWSQQRTETCLSWSPYKLSGALRDPKCSLMITARCSCVAQIASAGTIPQARRCRVPGRRCSAPGRGCCSSDWLALLNAPCAKAFFTFSQYNDCAHRLQDHVRSIHQNRPAIPYPQYSKGSSLATAAPARSVCCRMLRVAWVILSLHSHRPPSAGKEHQGAPRSTEEQIAQQPSNPLQRRFSFARQHPLAPKPAAEPSSTKVAATSPQFSIKAYRWPIR
jgi:hypothetical protein